MQNTIFLISKMYANLLITKIIKKRTYNMRTVPLVNQNLIECVGSSFDFFSNAIEITFDGSETFQILFIIFSNNFFFVLLKQCKDNLIFGSLDH